MRTALVGLTMICTLATTVRAAAGADRPMTVEEAYGIMQHRHAELDTRSLRLPPDETAFLSATRGGASTP